MGYTFCTCGIPVKVNDTPLLLAVPTTTDTLPVTAPEGTVTVMLVSLQDTIGAATPKLTEPLPEEIDAEELVVNRTCEDP